jgi:hypothetical protein
MGQSLVGKKLFLKDKPDTPAKRRMLVLSKDASLSLGGGAGSADDPTLHGATLRVRSSIVGGFDVTYDLPAAGWRLLKRKKPEKGWKFAKGEAVKKVLVKTGKQLRIVAKGAALGHTLAVDPAHVDVALTLGERTYCLGFGGPTATWVEGKKFLVKDSPVMGVCVP